MHRGRKKKTFQRSFSWKVFHIKLHMLICFVRSVYKNIDTYIYLLILLYMNVSRIFYRCDVFFWGGSCFCSLRPTAHRRWVLQKQKQSEAQPSNKISLWWDMAFDCSLRYIISPWISFLKLNQFFRTHPEARRLAKRFRAWPRKPRLGQAEAQNVSKDLGFWIRKYFDFGLLPGFWILECFPFNPRAGWWLYRWKP